ncbi:hypothetical protein [uncultured Arcobacter sp.]|uniref:hypothetical protein n=1 Tax=uncultured Arcobacter sp. TaxID=165434 RepID=UPI00262FE84D|nr:hypothetical protein [uncultured Arcobacter sp.]
MINTEKFDLRDKGAYQLIDEWRHVLEFSGETDEQKESAKIFREKVPDLEAITDFKEAYFLATQCEIAKQLGFLDESTVSGDVAVYVPQYLPILRRSMSALIGTDIFGVQQMQSASQQIFTLKTSYTNDSDTSVKRSNSAILVFADSTGLSVGDTITGDTSGATGTVLYIEGNVVLVRVDSGTFQEEDLNTATYTVSAVVDNETAFPYVLSNYSGSYTTADGEALSTDMKEIGFDISSVPVTARTRKVKAKFTNELEEDLRAVHNINAQQLLSQVASEEIAVEMNQEFIAKVNELAVANAVTSWDYSTADGRWEIEKYQNLLAVISRQARQIAVDTKRGQANWIIITPNVLTALEMTGKLDKTGVDFTKSAFVGTLNGTLKVYVDIYATGSYVLLGYKGNDMDAGFYYAPYVPLKIMKGNGEEDGQPRLFFQTRYGLVANPIGDKYFRKILINNLPV